jgi:NTP pyrophosphatase (non-canonical NTP hydrolase)
MENTTTKTLAELADEVDQFCHAKGWRENQVSFGEAMALLHTEIAEASDAWRRWGLQDATADVYDEAGFLRSKPEGVGSEFADIFIRLLDDSVLFSVDLDAEMYVHHGAYAVSDRFLENTDILHRMVARASDFWSEGEGDYRRQFAAILTFLYQLCGIYGIDLEAEYTRKMAYNKSRPWRHGRKRQ